MDGLREDAAVFFILTTSYAALQKMLDAPGLIWTTGLAKPPFVSTCSLWESAQASTTYAYGRREAAHRDRGRRTAPSHREW
jgi:hypothetical protein